MSSTFLGRQRRFAWLVALAFAGLWPAGPARADSHALILWIGEYADPAANLPGIGLDAENARRIAAGMGVPARNTIELSNAQLTRAGIDAALRALTDRLQRDDSVFIYYSGHGAQVVNATGSGRKCSEGLVAQEVELYLDADLEGALARLAAKARQVVMLNDSCFSGGAAEKSLTPGALGPLVAKTLPAGLSGKAATRGSAGAIGAAECGDAVNKFFGTKNLEVVRRAGANLLYMAAAADNEVAYATRQGSQATRAWAACVADPAADRDRSGAIDGEELRACAQAFIDRHGVRRQTITLGGGGQRLPVAFVVDALAAVDSGAGAFTAGPPGAGMVAGAAQAVGRVERKATAERVEPLRTLEDLRAAADATHGVRLLPAARALRIRRDFLDFSVETDRGGHLYVFQVGSDGRTFNLLFPNTVDADNRVGPGRHRLPRESWQLRSAGPAGVNHLMALVSSVPKDFGAVMAPAGPFATAPADPQASKNLVLVAAGDGVAQPGRYGVSEVVAIEEQP